MRLLLGVMVLGAALARAQAPPAPAIPDLEPRLEALTPDDSEPYFLLAEEVHDEAITPEAAHLARTLYVLAFTLQREGAPTDRRASVCIALADLARNEQDRRWLNALAYRLDPAYALPEWVDPRGAGVAPEAAYLAATTLGLARAGEGRMAEKLYAEPGVADAIARFDEVLAVEGLPGATRWLSEAIERWPCPNCRNERIVQLTRDDPPVRELCAVCGGNPGPSLTDAQLAAMLRFESRLLTGIHRSWAAQIAADMGAPLRDPDPSRLPAAMGVDPARTIWRDGAWTAPTPTIPPTAPDTPEESP